MIRTTVPFYVDFCVCCCDVLMVSVFVFVVVWVVLMFLLVSPRKRLPGGLGLGI